MGIREAYEAVEEKYYGLMDWLQDHRVPVYSVIDAFENRGVPTFPIFIIILIVLAFLAYGFVAGGGFGPLNSMVEITVKDGSGAALAGAQVTFDYGSTSRTLTTDEGGIAKLSVPYDSQVSVSVKREGFKGSTDSFTANKLDYKFPVTLEALSKTLKKTIQFVDNASGSLIKKELQLSFSCTGNASFSETKATSTGSVEVEVPEDCGSLNVSASNGYSVEGTGTVDLSESAPQILLSAPATDTGSVLVSVQGQDRNALPGIQVTLISGQGERIGPKTTGETGTALFEGIATGSYYAIAYDSVYGTVDTSTQSDGTKEVQKDQRTEFTITMQKQAAGKIKVLVTDKVSGTGIQNASVVLFKDKDKQIVVRKTDATGRVEFSVSENVNTYSVQVDALQYLKFTLAGMSPSVTEYAVQLTQATASNASSLLVKVSDEAGLPVEDARLKLKKVSDGSVVSEGITDLDGKATFERLDEGSYFVYAYKPGYGEQTSGAVPVNTRQVNKLEIQMVIGSGTIEVEALDSEGNPLNGAIARAFNQFNGQQVGSEKIAGADGKAQLNVRADKTVYVQVSASNYADYYTLPAQVPKGTTKGISVKMEQAPGSLGIEMLGYYSGAETATDSLAEGQKYTARLKLLVPAGENFSEAGAHFRTGSDDTDSVEKDAWFVKSGSAAGAILRKGSSYTKPAGYGTDLTRLTNGNAKWAEIAIKNSKPGIYEIAFDVQVRSGTQLGTVLESHYRAWAKIGESYTRFPYDSVLGELEAVSGKQALYAYTKTDILTVGPSTLCNDTFCYTFTMEDLGSNVKTSVVDEYSATISSNYRLYFSLTSKSSTLYGNAKLRLSAGSGMQLGNYSATIVGGAKRTGSVQGNSLELEVGGISNKDNVSGSVDFSTPKEGSTTIALSVVSGSTVFQKGILVNVASANQMAVSVIPKTIIPFVQNDLLVTAFDDANSAIAGASVTIKKNDSIIATGTTDSTGTFAYSLAAVNAGTVITIKIEKTGFAPFERKMTVSQNIITFAPEKVSVLLLANGKDSAEKVVGVQNGTAIPLVVTSVKASSDFSGMVSFKFAEEYAGRALENGVDFNLDFTATLTDAGRQVTAPTTIKGSILLQVESASQAKEWIAALPVEVRIGFGGEVDDSTCLVLGQSKWNLSTGKSEQTLTLDLKNACTVDAKPAALQGLQAKVSRANTSALGTYSVASNIENSSSISLTTSYADLAPSLEAGGEYTLSITFKPADIVSGKANEKILLKASNRTNSGVEEITAQLEVSIVVSDLAQCVTVSQQKQIYINTCPYNLGYGNYGNYFQQYPQGYGMQGYSGSYGTGSTAYNSMSPYYTNPYQYYGYSTTQRPWLGNLQQQYQFNYPNSQYRSPTYDGFYYNQGSSQAYAGQYFCGQGEFRVANNCASDVHIDIDAGSAIQASQTSFDLKPSQDMKVQVEAGYRMGRYPIEVRAKVKDSTDAPTLLQTIQAIVQSFSEVNYDCIVLDPAEKLSITEFIGKPVSMKIYNNCYDQGVRLFDSTQNPILVYELSYTGGTYNPQTVTQGTIPPAANVQMIQQVRALPKVVKPAADNRLVEEMTVQVIPNVAFREQAALELRGGVFKQIGNVRAYLTQGYYRIEEMADVIVRYSTPVGQGLAKQFPIVIEDLFAATEYLEKVGVQGNPKITDNFGQCLEKSPINFGNMTLSKGETTVIETTNFNNSLIIIDNSHCGWGDSLELPGARGGKKDMSNDNFAITVEVTNNGHSLKITITPKAEPPKSGAAINLNIAVNINRASTDAGPKTLPAGTVNITVNVQGREAGAALQPQACSGSGYTGTGAYQKYGFDKLLWAWEFEQVEKDAQKGWTCDVREDGKGQGYYCDATQFQIELNKKGVLIAEYAEKNPDVVTAMNSNVIKDASELPMVSKKKAILHDRTPQGTVEMGFFMKSDSEFLEGEKIDANADADLKAFAEAMRGVTQVTPSNAKMITTSANAALKRLVAGQYANSILITLGGAAMEAHANTLYELGAEKPALKGSPAAQMAGYAMTLKDFARMHDLVDSNAECAEKTSCSMAAIAGLDGKDDANGQTRITSQFLKDFYSASRFVVGTINAASLDIGTVRRIANEAQDRETAKSALPEGYGSFKDFYYELVDFSANLKRDNINANFIADFDKAYEANFIADFDKAYETKFKDLEGSVSVEMAGGKASIDSAGTYAVLFKFGLNRPDELALAKKADLPADYAKNPLFGIPFDGKAGFSADGLSVERKGYGTGYGKQAQSISLTMPKDMSPAEIAKLLTLPQDAQSSDALVKIDAQYLSPTLSGDELAKANEEMRKGLILSVSNSSLKFGASKPVPLQLKVSAGSNGAMAAYDIAGTEGELTSGLGNSIDNQSVWLDWELACSTNGNRDFSNKAFGPIASDRPVSRGGVFKRDYRGFEWNSPTFPETMVLRGLAVQPYTHPMVLGDLEALDSAVLSCKNCSTGGGKEEIVSGGGNYVSLGIGEADAVSIAQSFELLKDSAEAGSKGKACVDFQADGSMSLKWNKDYYYSLLPKPAECSAS